jgi:hypothetical protein
VAGVLAKAGQDQQAAVLVDEAEALARSIMNPQDLGHILARVAGARAEAGQHRQAEALARSIANPEDLGHALAQVAESLAQAGEACSAARIAAEVCTLGRWSTAARPVLLLVPAASTTLVRALEEPERGAVRRSFS